MKHGIAQPVAAHSPGQSDGEIPQTVLGRAQRPPGELADLIQDFEREWSSGGRPQIEDYLPRIAESQREKLFEELLRRDIVRTVRAGEKVSYKPLLARFSDYVYQVEEVYRDLQNRKKSRREDPALTQTYVTSKAVVETKRTDTPASPPPATSPASLGRFQIVKRLGQGAFGTVYLADDPDLGRKVALKVPRQGTVFSSEEAERFQREARTAALLRHPHICPVYDVGTDEDSRYIVMAYIEGRPLSHVLQERALSHQEAVELVRKIALALGEAHGHGIVHRDLKPSNVIIERDTEPVIMDFGLARCAKAQEETLTVSGQIIGTPAYMSPEQAAGNTIGSDQQSDIYSLGVMLYEMLTGQRPFSGGLHQLLYQVVHETAPRPSTIQPGIDPQLEVIVLKAIAKSPSDRFSTMAEFAECLAVWPPTQGDSSPRALKSRHASMATTVDMPPPTQAIVPSPPSSVFPNLVDKPHNELPKRKSRPRWPLIAVAGVCLAALAGLTAWMVSRPPSSEAETVAEKSAPETTETPKEDRPDRDPSLDRIDPITGEVATPVPIKTQLEEQYGVTKPKVPIQPAAVAERFRRPQTFVVDAESEYETLKEVFDAVQAGDTIQINHPGPLEFYPEDLTGKTPLKIIGGSRTQIVNGKEQQVEYRPIIRQRGRGKHAPGLFFSKQDLDLEFHNLHLAVGGYQRSSLDAVFSGRDVAVMFHDCTVTVRHTGSVTETPDAPIPFVKLQSQTEGAAEVAFENSLFRGLRLGTCVWSKDAAAVDVRMTESVWAGAATPWLTINGLKRNLRVSLQNATVYNTASLLAWDSPRREGEAEGDAPAVAIQAKQSLIAGTRLGTSPLIVWNRSDTDNDLPAVADKKMFAWHGERNILHGFAGLYEQRNSSRPAELKQWHGLWNQDSAGGDVDEDPMFRVRPDGEFLCLVEARDFHPRFRQDRRRRLAIKHAGAHWRKVAAAIPLVTEMSSTKIEDKLPPRGVPKLIVVNQEKGPHKTLESAFQAVEKDGDVIEITDSGVYTPRRNFSANPGRAILRSPVDHLTIRAADGQLPMLAIQQRLQRSAPTSVWLIELEPTSDASWAGLTLDGLHFRGDTPRTWGFVRSRKGALRCTNSTFEIHGDEFNAIFGDLQMILWVENTACRNTATTRNGGFYAHPFDGCAAQSMVFRNNLITGCVFVGGGGTLTSLSHRLFIQLQSNSLLGLFSRRDLKLGLQGRAEIESNLLHEPEIQSRFSSLGGIRFGGERNAVWSGNRPLSVNDRAEGIGRVFPGPLLLTPPQFEGTSTLAKPYRRWELKRNQPAATMAADGGPVGVRTEYLPDLPKIPAGALK